MHCFIWETSTGLSCRENFVRSPHLTEKVCFFLAGHFPEWKYVQFLKLEPNKHSDGVEERVGVFIPPELASFMEEGSASEARPGPMPSFTDVRPWWGCLIRHLSLAIREMRWVCQVCLSGGLWSSDELVAVKAPNSCDPRSRAPGVLCHIRPCRSSVTPRL